MESVEAEVRVGQLSPNAWIAWLVLGLLSIGVGVWLVLSPEVAVATLAILLAIALFFNGLGELVGAGDLRRPWVGYLLGGIYVLAAVVVLVRPGKSLWFLAIVVGVSIILTGLIQLAVALADRDVVRHAALLALLGVLSVVVGILAVAWPEITIRVLALLIGIRLVIWGAVQLAIAFGLRSLAR